MERFKVEEFCKEKVKPYNCIDSVLEATMLLKYLPRITQIYFSHINVGKILMFDGIYSSSIEFVPTSEFLKLLEES